MLHREADGNSWRHYCRGLPPASRDLAERLVARVADRVASLLVERRSMYQPGAIDIGEIHCK